MHALESSAFRFILFYLIRKQMRMQCRCPPPFPFVLTAELAYTSIEIKIQCLKYLFYWILKLQKHRACAGVSKHFQTSRKFYHAPGSEVPDVYLPLACMNLHSDSTGANPENFSGGGGGPPLTKNWGSAKIWKITYFFLSSNFGDIKLCKSPGGAGPPRPPPPL